MIFRELIGVSTFDPKEAESFGEDPLFVRAAARAVAILSAFEVAHKPLSLKELSEISGVDRSATQRMVHTLQALGMIMRDEEDRGYLLGKRILTMAHSALRLNPLLQRATPILLELRRRTRERVDMSLWDDTRLIYALRLPSKHQIFTATLTGNTVPLYCTAGGISIMMHLPDQEIARIFHASDQTPYTPNTFTRLDQVIDAVHAARKRGYALLSGQLLRYEVAMAVAVLDGANRPVGAIHIGSTTAEHSLEEFSSKFGTLLEQAGNSLSSFR